MKKFSHLLSFFILCSCVTYASPRTVDFVDVNRYMGTWYEIASIPQFFSKGCFCSRAHYSLQKNGEVGVYNSCNKESIEGDLSDVNGKARVTDSKTNSKLKVSFFWPFSGDYWIVGLDKDYRYAVISNKKASSLWILSRTPKLASSDLQAALKIAQENKIPVQKLTYTTQEGCRYPEEN